MSELDAKVNMSLDEIIKMEKKKKKNTKMANGKPGIKRNRGAIRGRTGFRGRGARIKRNVGTTVKKQQVWQRSTAKNNIRNGFINRYRKNENFMKPRINSNINNKNTRGGTFNVRRGRGNRFGLTRSRSRTNLASNQSNFLNNKNTLKKTNSLPNLRDPTSVHNRLGYQSPAQIIYQNRVKRAKQLLLRRQNQRLNLQNQFRFAHNGQALLSLQPRSMERKQQILTSQRRFTTGGLRSDQIARMQRRAQYQERLMNAAQVNSSHCLCTLGKEYTSILGQRPSISTHGQHDADISNRGRLKCYKITIRNLKQGDNMVLPQDLGSKSLSPLPLHNTMAFNYRENLNSRTFNEIIHSLSRNCTRQTLNNRFSS